MKKIIELNPIKQSSEDYEEMEKRLLELFKQEIYLPILKDLKIKNNILKNSTEDLIEAIKAGRINYSRGQFTGGFNATLSRELKKLGARWDRKQGSYSIPLSKLPIDVKTAISISEVTFVQRLKAIDQKLSQILPEEIANKVKLEDLFEKTIWKTDNKFNDSIKKITVAPQLTKDQSQRIAKEYTENMKLYIKDWLGEEIVVLRKDMQKRVFEGRRYESAIKIIQKSYGVSQSKAKFLARQETNLLVSKFKETRYESAGVREYKWRSVIGSSNHPVRPRHKELNDMSMNQGKIFRFDDPPIVDPDTGRRGNPGEDYNCRCQSIPVVRF